MIPARSFVELDEIDRQRFHAVPCRRLGCSVLHRNHAYCSPECEQFDAETWARA